MTGQTKALRYPDFIGIGAQKAGTTWAYEQLKAHPQIFVPDTKELNFFYSDRSKEWYAQQFQDAPTDSVVGEVSPNYFVRSEIPQRMQELVPAAKLFCILRNPTERAFSQWKMARQLGNIPIKIPFIDAFRRNLRWMAEQGEYLKLLERYEASYPMGEKLLVLFFDDILLRPGEVTCALYQYLGVNQGFDAPDVKTVVAGSTNSTVISEEDRQEVQRFYERSVLGLGRRFGRDLTHWTDAG